MTTNGAIAGYTKTDRPRFEVMLLERRRQLAGDLHALEEEELQVASETPAESSHLADLGSDRAASDLNLSCRESATGEIQQIDDALERLKDGSYGLCETCEQPMARARMEAIPYARLCLTCKTVEER